MTEFVKILPGQSIFDLAVQHYGNIEAVKYILQLNEDLNLSDTPVALTLIKIDSDYIQDEAIVKYFKSKFIDIVTSTAAVILPPDPDPILALNDIEIKLSIDTYLFDYDELVVDADLVSTILTITSDVDSGVVNVLLNGSAISLPAELNIGDILTATRSIADNVGWIKLSGKYE